MTVENLFLSVFDLSLVGGATIIVLLIARQFMRSTTKVYSYLLWLAAAYRLVGGWWLPNGYLIMSKGSFGVSTVGQAVTGVTFTGMPDSVFQAVEAAIPSLAPAPYTSVNPIQLVVFLFANLWVIGVAAMLLHSIWTALRLHRQLAGATSLGDHVYLAHSIRTPFVMGIFRPRIYLPAGLADDEQEYILLHERTHIRRCDHIIKPLAFLLLAVHWFNPLVWLGFYLMSRDMEMSCDESVLKKLGNDVKQPYASSLLALAAPRGIWCGSPLAFGEGHAGSRIKNLLGYKKPAMWVTVVVITAVVWLIIGLVSDTPYEDGDWISQMYATRTNKVGQHKDVYKLAELLPPVEGMDKGVGKENDYWSRNSLLTVTYTNTAVHPSLKGYWGNNAMAATRIPPIAQLAYTAAEGVEPTVSAYEGELQRNALITFALLPSAEQVRFDLYHAGSDSGALSHSYTRDWAKLTMGYDPADHSGSLEDFRRLYNELDRLLAAGLLPLANAGFTTNLPQGTIEASEGETVAQTAHRERFEAPIFEFTPTNIDHGRQDILTFVDTYLSYYTNPNTNKNWQGHTNTRTNSAVTSSDRNSKELSSMRVTATYDLVLSGNPEADTTHWLATSGNPVTVTPDGIKMVVDNSIALRIERVDESHYALRSVTSYRGTDVWLGSTTHAVASQVEQLVEDIINTYREGGLNVHQTMGEGFAAPPTDILWADFNYITVRQLDGTTAQASVIVDDRYTMVMESSVEGASLDSTVISTIFTRRE